MEIFFYLLTITIVLFGISHLIISFIVFLFMRLDISMALNIGSISGAFIVWTLMDTLWVVSLNQPIPIGLFLVCWAIKLINNYIQNNKAVKSGIPLPNSQIHVHMAEAWVLFIWAIVSMFLDYRLWF